MFEELKEAIGDPIRDARLKEAEAYVDKNAPKLGLTPEQIGLAKAQALGTVAAMSRFQIVG